MPTVKEMMEHCFSSDEEEEGVHLDESPPFRKKRRCVPAPTKMVCKSDATLCKMGDEKNKASTGIVGSVGSDEVSTSQSSKLKSTIGNVGDNSSTSYDSEDSGHTSNSSCQGNITLSGFNPPPPSIPLVQEDMDPTKGAVAALTTGAISSNGDINAIFDDGKVECLAGQVIMEDEGDGSTRCQMFWEEYYPILQVQRIV